jgi:DNA polymerase
MTMKRIQMAYKPEGDPAKAEITFIGEAPARKEIESGRPFVGPAGWVFDECLQGTGLLRTNAYITNVFNQMVVKPKNRGGTIVTKEGDVLFTEGRGFSEAGMKHVRRLQEELERTKCNVFIPMGSPALRAVCGVKGIMNYRGSILPSTLVPEVKCVPTIHPANALHGQYINRYLIRRDFKRAARENRFPEINRPAYKFAYNWTFAQYLAFLNEVKETKPRIAVDIEVARKQASYICIATSPLNAVSIPLQTWKDTEEATLWLALAEVLESEDIPKVFQNGCFDIQFLAQVHGVHVRGVIDDTMVLHHIMYPDFKKGLGFLTSIHTDQPYYKAMVKHGEIEKVEG